MQNLGGIANIFEERVKIQNNIHRLGDESVSNKIKFNYEKIRRKREEQSNV